jgi:hypothetical protein
VLGLSGAGLAKRLRGEGGLPGPMVIPEGLAYGAVAVGLLALAHQVRAGVARHISKRSCDQWDIASYGSRVILLLSCAKFSKASGCRGSCSSGEGGGRVC